ncbi:MAG: glutamate synthase (NADPH), homotetrameric [Thermoprotei archaeon]|nr:MAG: glutamate synthase (NADPH), homotetrameric [Thermoprotei archaeon]
MVSKRAVPMRKLSMDKRLTTFEEVALGYTEEEALEEAKRCLKCKLMPCSRLCPLNIEVPEFVKCIERREYEKGLNIILKANPFPAITGRVCPQEVLCQKECTLRKLGDPLAIGRLERFLGDYQIENNIMNLNVPEKVRGSVAVVGSGPAGLMGAVELRKLGYEVTIFEALHEVGGVMVYGIPEFRLPRRVLRFYVDYVKKLGVRIEVDVVVGRTYTIDELLREYDAVLLATGAGTPKFLGIPGEELNGVYSANEFLIRINLMKAYRFPEYDTPIKLGKRIAVIGGGNTAMDVSRIALRLGAEEVIVLYRRTEVEMPARREEVENAKEEGVKFMFLTQPIALIGDEKGWIRKIKCIRMRLGEPDASGRRRPIPIPGSEFDVEVDNVIIAIGAEVNKLIQRTTPGLKVDKRGHVIVDKYGRTSIKRVYAAGDVVTGAATVIEALAAAKTVAHTIHRDLSG